MHTPRRSAIESQIQTTQRNLREATELHAAASLRLVDAPADKKVQTELDQLDREIAGYERSLDRLHAALAEDARRSSAEFTAETHRAAKASRTRANELALKRIGLAEQVDRTFATLREQLAAIEAMNHEVSTAARDAVRPFADRRMGDISDWATIRPPALDVVRDTVNSRFFNEHTVKEIAQHAADRLATKLAHLVPRGEA